MQKDDTQLLFEFAHSGAQNAFAELVRRHIDMVYGAARRQTRDADLAEDVTQTVFILLAKKAYKVRNGAVLPAWLLSCTRYAAANARTAAVRRRHHENEAAAMKSEQTDQPDPRESEALIALLDKGLAKLPAI